MPDPKEDLTDEAFRSATGASLGATLLKAGRLMDERALERIRARTGVPIRPAHTKLVPHVPLDGIRATELAQRLGVTKQAITPLIRDFVKWGLAEQVPDPDDRRARLVRWTEEGRRGAYLGLATFREIEAEWAAEVGTDTLVTVHEALTVLAGMLE